MRIEREHRTGSPARGTLTDLREAIDHAKGIADLLPMIVALLQETEAVIDGRTLNDDDIRLIATPLAKIRFLLTALAARGGDPVDSSREGALISELIERYQDIEGRLKEMRNDHAPSRGSRAA